MCCQKNTQAKAPQLRVSQKEMNSQISLKVDGSTFSSFSAQIHNLSQMRMEKMELKECFQKQSFLASDSEEEKRKIYDIKHVQKYMFIRQNDENSILEYFALFRSLKSTIKCKFSLHIMYWKVLDENNIYFE